ncbi:AT-hook motif nuclear-localized protein 5-like [Cucurbita maxima]|uniref:AT-hook motif nuclear-localized protein n=1 Tax=Cucurbita maxima TaxID=3661 RepID=A0A6J1I2Z1_CUCMA|nr:AT-hook motif nuclear-localized protein 5-like [Cucurbita maxima]
MDGREGMALSGGSASYYIHRGGGLGGSGSGVPTAGSHASPVFRPMANQGVLSHSNLRGNSVGSTYTVEPSHSNYLRGMSINASAGVNSGEPVKRKRGRPRKYAPDGQVSLGLSPMSVGSKLSPGMSLLTPRRRRGRPPGSGRKQQLAQLGEWMNDSAGLAFAPHVIHVGAGEDIVAKVLSFAQQRPRAVCILSGNGTVSSVTLRQPASTGVSVTYEGHFQILCLSGSYLVAEDGGPRSRTGGISVSLSSPDGHVVGGGVAVLMAAGPVQVVVCSFVYGAKIKNKQVAGPKSNDDSRNEHHDNMVSPTSAPSAHAYNPSPIGGWPGSRSIDVRNSHTGIDLTRG